MSHRYNTGMIRATIPADNEALVAITEATGIFKPIEIAALRDVLDDFHRTRHSENHRSVTLEEEGVILGFAYYGPAPMTAGTWQLWWLAVRKDQQGRGAGSRLLNFVESDIRTQLGRVLFIETGSPVQYDMTRQFYRKHGYEQHAILKDYYAENDSMIIFRKALS
jgi:ribosomal protein S18 acetylase RimI-like enzyme